eukprot:scaffold1954_cov33-Attheya_sp.AAC.3
MERDILVPSVGLSAYIFWRSLLTTDSTRLDTPYSHDIQDPVRIFCFNLCHQSAICNQINLINALSTFHLKEEIQ